LLVIALSALKRFFEARPHGDAREPLLAWYRHALKADWRAPADVKRDFGSASILRDGPTTAHRGLGIPAESLIKQADRRRAA
jgi:mRNA-degrading endonuclease HigB of HigAB toxin-antitoxin module